MRFLHTSDWHLGVSIKHVECQEEQELFLKWLVETLEARAIDVLVVAGDIFHYATPSNAARRAYYRFLHRCTKVEGLRKIVIVAGNHDSASGLEAPKELLDLLNVHVVGGLGRDEDDWAHCLVPVRGDSGEVEVVVAAVPYLQEVRLGVSLGAGGEDALRAAYRAAFSRLYQHLADEAQARWPGAKLVATGHLTAYGDPSEAQPGDYQSGIHSTPRPEMLENDGGAWLENDGGQPLETRRTIGTIEAMDPEIFGADYCYVALGHIHRPMPVGGLRHIRYSGSPVASTVKEAETARQVIQVEISADSDPQNVAIEAVKVPCWREIFELRGFDAELVEMLRTMRVDSPLAPAVFINVRLDAEDPAGVDRFERYQAILREHHPPGRVPIIVDIREAFAALGDAPQAPKSALGPVEELSYLDIFQALYERRHPGAGGPSEGLIAKFRQIEQQLHDHD